MFKSLIRCVSLAKSPFTIKPSHTLLRGINKSPINFTESGIIGSHDFLLLKKGFSGTSASKFQDINKTDASESSSSSLSTENKNQIEEEIREELKTAIEADPLMLKRYKILQLEIDVMRHAGKLVPEELKPQHWLQLLKEETRTARRKYLQFLFKNEKRRENQRSKKEIAKTEREHRRETCPEVVEDTEYRLHRVAMFMRIYDTTMNNFYHSRLIQAMSFGEKLVIDCGYFSHMTPRECTECAKQLSFLFAQNRIHKEPFDLHFCNVDKSSLIMQKLNRIIPTLYDPTFPINITEKSYLDTFDKDKLVYLTPHCTTEMEEYDPDMIYIIGAIVDKTNSEPLSLARAKKENLKMAKLPLDKYLLWASGSGKRLPLNQILGILADLKLTKDWQIALKHVPRRKLERDIKDFDPTIKKFKRNYDINDNGNRGTKGFQRNYDNDDRRTKKFDRSYNEFDNNGPFKPYEKKTLNSFSYNDRQKKTFNK